MPRDYTKHAVTGIPVQWCPVCFYKLDSCGSMGNLAVPEPGDFIVCIDCGSVLKFNQDMITVPSSLVEVPDSVRMEYSKIVLAVKACGPVRRKNQKQVVM